MKRRRGIAFRRWFAVLLAAAVLALPLPSPRDPGALAEEQVTPRAEYWRQVREGVEGVTAVQGQETGVLIQGMGQNWRQLRNGPVAALGVGLIGIVVLVLGAFYLWRGQVKIDRPRTGRRIERWNLAERALHWYTATLFIFLALTGLAILYGRAALIPLIGHEAFAAFAGVAKWTHNVGGLMFIVGLVAMLAVWIRDNIPRRVDIDWFLAGGGLVGHKHPSAGRMNGGEKAWFWLLASAGILVSVSGLVLDFPNFGQERLVLQLSHLLHVAMTMLLIAGALGHIYIGTVGTEGALEGMTTGYVDVAWAEQHHDLWCEELREKGTSADKPTPLASKV
jgi:formate dehydrogenase subunit gamma